MEGKFSLPKELFCFYITFFGDDAERTEVSQPCDQWENSQIEPFDPRKKSCCNKGKSQNNPDRSAYFSDLVYIHNIISFKIFV